MAASVTNYVPQDSNFTSGNKYLNNKPSAWRHAGKIAGSIALVASTVLLGAGIITGGIFASNHFGGPFANRGVAVLMPAVLTGSTVAVLGSFGTGFLLCFKVDWNKYHEMKKVHKLSKEMTTWSLGKFTDEAKCHGNLFQFGFIGKDHKEKLNSFVSQYKMLYSWKRENKYQKLLKAREKEENLVGEDNPLYSVENNEFIKNHKDAKVALKALDLEWNTYWKENVVTHLPMLRVAAPSA